MNSSTWSVYKTLQSSVLTDSSHLFKRSHKDFFSLSYAHKCFSLSPCAGLCQILLQPTALMGSADLCSHFSPGLGRRGMPFSTLKDTQTPIHTLILHHLDPDPCSIFSRGAEKRAQLSHRATSSWRRWEVTGGHRWARKNWNCTMLYPWNITKVSILLKLLGLKISKSNELERKRKGLRKMAGKRKW